MKYVVRSSFSFLAVLSSFALSSSLVPLAHADMACSAEFREQLHEGQGTSPRDVLVVCPGPDVGPYVTCDCHLGTDPVTGKQSATVVCSALAGMPPEDYVVGSTSKTVLSDDGFEAAGSGDPSVYCGLVSVTPTPSPTPTASTQPTTAPTTAPTSAPSPTPTTTPTASPYPSETATPYDTVDPYDTANPYGTP